MTWLHTHTIGEDAVSGCAERITEHIVVEPIYMMSEDAAVPEYSVPGPLKYMWENTSNRWLRQVPLEDNTLSRLTACRGRDRQ